MIQKHGSRSKVLITGMAGFIGQNLALILRRDFEGYDLKFKQDIFDPKFEDLVKKYDIIIHLAATTSVDNSFKNPRQYFEINTLGTARVAYLCLKYKKKLIYPSTAAVYHRELSPYAESKALAEDIVRSLIPFIPVTILRFYNVYGQGMNPDSGSIMYNFLHDKKITVYGDGEQTRDFINVKDVVSVIKDSIKGKWNGKIVDVGTGQATSINYIAGLFAFYRRLKIEYKPLRREIKWSIAPTQMLETLYKKPLLTNLEKDIEELCRS